jgi:hypothetical protein
MRTNDKRFFSLILILAAIGIVYSLAKRPSAVVIPILVLGTVFLLYKFPPASWRRKGAPRSGAGRPRPSPPRKKRSAGGVKLRVIPGRKKDEPPGR